MSASSRHGLHRLGLCFYLFVLFKEFQVFLSAVLFFLVTVHHQHHMGRVPDKGHAGCSFDTWYLLLRSCLAI